MSAAYTHGMRPLLLAAALAGCVEIDPPPPERAYIAPLDGQTEVAGSARLLVRTGSFEVPPQYALPELVRVTDLEDGGAVEGTTEIASDTIVFTPLGGWAANRRYAWTIPALVSTAHGPSMDLPAHLVGTAAFDTSADLYMLGATWDPNEALLCLVFSRRLTADDTGVLRVTVDDEEIAETLVRLIPDEEWGKPYELYDEDDGIDVMCIDDGVDRAEALSVRVWWGDEGPWYADLLAGTAAEHVQRLRRANW